MSRWAREHPEQMTEIAALPLSGQRAALADAMRGNRREERAEALRNASRAAQKAKDEMLFGFSAEKDGERIDPFELLDHDHKATARYYLDQIRDLGTDNIADRIQQEAVEHHDDLRKDAEEDTAIEAEEAENE